MSYMEKDKYLFLFFISQLNISGQQCYFLYITDTVCYPQMMYYIYVTALPMDRNSLAWETRKNNQPTTNYSQVFIYLKGKCPISDKQKKGKKNLKKWTALLKHPISKPFLQHIVLPSITLWVWSSTSIPPFESRLLSKHSCQLLTWHQP